MIYVSHTCAPSHVIVLHMHERSRGYFESPPNSPEIIDEARTSYWSVMCRDALDHFSHYIIWRVFIYATWLEFGEILKKLLTNLYKLCLAKYLLSQRTVLRKFLMKHSFGILEIF